MRPDRCGVVIDPIVELIRVDGVEVPAAQIWVRPGREMAFTEDLILGAILGLLKQVPFVLWRQRGQDGRQMARAIGHDKAGRFGIGPLVEANYDLGPEHERWARVDRLMTQRERR